MGDGWPVGGQVPQGVKESLLSLPAFLVRLLGAFPPGKQA